MAKKRMSLDVSKVLPKRFEDISKFQRVTIFFVILVITPNISLEPINPVKLLVLSGGAVSTIALALISRHEIKSRVPIRFLVPAILFVLMLLISSFANSIGFSRSFYGEWGRNTAILFYVCLIVLFFTSYISSSVRNAILLEKTILLATFINFLYMVIQYLELDPIDWSVLQTFGFTGNLNFASSLSSILCTLLLGRLLNSEVAGAIKLAYALTIFCSLFIVYESGSLQGIVQFALAALLLIFSTPRLSSVLKSGVKFLITFVFLSAGLLSIASSFPKFLNGALFQQTMSYRQDYWLAGLRIMGEFPWFGVGTDNYGNFYRQFRDAEAALDIERQSNSAHSIPIDIGAGNGIIAMILYLVFIFFIYLRVLRVLASNTSPLAVKTICVIWISLQLQNFYGINQATTGILTFTLGGLLAGMTFSQRNYGGSTDEDSERALLSRNILKKVKAEPISANALVKGSIGFVLGALIALPNFVADAAYWSAKQKSDYGKMEEIAFSPYFGNQTLSEFLLEDIVVKEADGKRGLALARKITEKFPRSIYAWKVIITLVETPEGERSEALAVYSKLDPFGANGLKARINGS